MELADVDRSILVVIDLQGKLVDKVHRSALVLQATHRLLELAQLFSVPVVLTEQYPRGLGPTHPELLARFDALTVPRRRVEKGAFGCFGDPGFEAALAEVRPGVAAGERQLVVAGIEAHVCVMQTVLEARRLGQEVHLCWEAVSGPRRRAPSLGSRAHAPGRRGGEQPRVGRLRVGAPQGPRPVQGDVGHLQAGADRRRRLTTASGRPTQG